MKNLTKLNLFESGMCILVNKPFLDKSVLVGLGPIMHYILLLVHFSNNKNAKRILFLLEACTYSFSRLIDLLILTENP